MVELERIYGIRKGSANSKGINQYTKNGDGNNFVDQKTQKDLADNLEMEQRQLQNYKRLLKLIPELQLLVEEEKITPTIGYAVWATGWDFKNRSN